MVWYHAGDKVVLVSILLPSLASVKQFYFCFITVVLVAL